MTRIGTFIALVLVATSCYVAPTVRWTIPASPSQTHCRPVQLAAPQLGESLVVETGQGRSLASYRSTDARRRWRVDFGDECLLVDQVNEATVLAVLTQGGRRPSDRSSSVVALDAREGRTLWSVPLEAYPLPALPVLDTERGYVATRRHRNPHPEGRPIDRDTETYDADHRLRAFDLRNGRELWSQRLRMPPRYNPVSSVQLLADGRRVFALTAYLWGNWSLDAFDAASGQPLWAHPDPFLDRFDAYDRGGWIGGLADGSIVRVDRRRIEVYDPETGALHALPLEPALKRDLDRAIRPLVVGTVLYLFSYGENSLTAIDPRTGARHWRRSFRESRDWKNATPGYRNLGYHEGLLSLGAQDGNIYVMHADTGKLVGYVDPSEWLGHLGESPALPAEGGVIVSTFGGIYLFELRGPWLRFFLRNPLGS